MASVRLTKDLQSTIVRAVREDFNTVLEGYEYPESTEDTVAEYARLQLAEANKEYEAIVADVVAVAVEPIKAHGGAIDDAVTDLLANAVRRNVSEWDGYYVKCADPENEGKEIVLYYCGNPYKSLHRTKRFVPRWSSLVMSDTRACRDENIINDLLPLYLKRRSIEQAQKLAIEYAESMMAGCTTLKQLIRKWPDAVNVVPDKYLNSMDDKVPHAPRAAEEPVAIMNIDDAMKSIRLQAEAVRALK